MAKRAKGASRRGNKRRAGQATEVEPVGVAGPAHPAPLAWALEFLPEYFSSPPCQFHVELMGDLANETRRLIARVAPRGHAKSTCAALAYPLWCICEQRRRNIVIVTHEASLATQFVRDIREELTANERLLAAYGDLCSARAGRRSAAHFATTTGCNVQAKGTGASFRGLRVGPHRPDLVVCDDLEKDELVDSPDGRRKLEQWLRRVVMPALAPQGQLLVLGSLLHYDSLLANLRDRQRFPGWDYRVYRALEAAPQSDGTYRRVALWPARWPVERLDEERRRIGPLAFEQEYQANPADDSLRVFRPEWLRRYEERELVEERLVTLLAVDPATGTGGGDFFALWVGSVDTETSVIYTRQLTLERVGIVGQVQRIIAAFERWRPVRVGIETTAYQVALKEALEEESRRRGLYIPVVGLKTTAKKRARIEGSSVWYANGTFRLPAVLPPEIEEQFLHFPKARHDDAPDVCAMGIELAGTMRVTRRFEGAVAQWNPFARRGGW